MGKHIKEMVVAFLFLSTAVFAADFDQYLDVEFINKLEDCQPYKKRFKHPLTREILLREIIGEEEGKCYYTEEMPNGGKMECRYSLEQRKVVAQYYKYWLSDRAEETSISIKIPQGESKTIYKLDGKEVANPLQECLNSGACVVSGYE